MTQAYSLAAGLALALTATSAAAESVELTVDIRGAEPATGTVEISLFNSDENFLKAPYVQTACKPDEDGHCTARFDDLAAGEYAVVVVHDANDNKKFDNGFLGIGSERYAYSNEAGSLFFGRASFDDAKIRIEVPTEIEIDLD